MTTRLITDLTDDGLLQLARKRKAQAQEAIRKLELRQSAIELPTREEIEADLMKQITPDDIADGTERATDG